MSVQDNVKVKVPGLSGFDKSFKHILTTKVGTLTPLMCKYVMPGAKGSLKLAVSACLPPLASDTFMRANLKVEAFLVPMRLLYAGTESWLAKKKVYDPVNNVRTTAEIPILQYGGSGDASYLGPGTLADYLGFRMDPANIPSGTHPTWNVFPFLCYYRVIDDWYRHSKLGVPYFTPVDYRSAAPYDSTHRISYLPYVVHTTQQALNFGDQFINGARFGALQQRNYGSDYFTVAMATVQSGSAQSVSTSGGSYTIASLRTANSLQQWAERSGYAGDTLQDYCYAHYGANLASGVAQRAILLGSASYPVYSKGVEANSANAATNNPFTTVAANYGRGMASGTDFICKFECNEPSYLLVMASLVPEANYAHGLNHEFLILNGVGAQIDLPDPLLENVGNEPIWTSELTGDAMHSSTVFGYVPKNTWYKTATNQVSGLLRAGQSLDSFVAQRTFSGTPTLGNVFLHVNTTDLNNVTAVTADLANYGCWIDSFINLKTVEPLVDNAIPSLQDPAYEHGKTVVLDQKHNL